MSKRESIMIRVSKEFDDFLEQLSKEQNLTKTKASSELVRKYKRGN